MYVESYLKRLKVKEEGDNLWIRVGKSKLPGILKRLKSLGVHRISSISGVDVGKSIDVIYHFIHKNKTVNIRVSLNKGNPEVESITSLFPGANLFERELAEMLGIQVKNHPNMKKLFLSKDSPRAPYRKS